MKKMLAMAVGMFILLSGSVSAHGTTVHPEKNAGITIRVNGVEVKSSANHQSPNGKVYVSVKAFADLFGQTFTVSEGRRTVQFNDKTISDIQMKQGEPTAWIRDLANAVSAQNVSWDKAHQEVYVLALPEGSVKISEVVPAMGEHWANPQAGELPVGPIYGVYDGKLVFLEYMIAQDDFVKGKSLINLRGMKGVPSPAVVQLDAEFQPQGHPGFEAPHYDIHAYFITDEEQQQIK
ncbi:hypothetical protein ACFPPD_11320 [Cohnella suwonensis]|uniref:Copper amine oxidase-like N-terminal domain-containing protein n=1 Tax=Cohnella suwonensis TaxID=696072 RepID=A0ABW0LWT5_9BACL